MKWGWILRMREPKTTQVLTYTAKRKVETIKEYPTGAEVGSPALLTTYTYNVPGDMIKIEVTKSTV